MTYTFTLLATENRMFKSLAKKDPDVHFICYRIGNSYVQIICYKIEKILTCTFTLLAKNRKLYVQITHHEKDPDMYIHIARHRIENRMFKSSAIK